MRAAKISDDPNPTVDFRLGKENNPVLIQLAADLSVEPPELAKALALKALREKDAEASLYEILAVFSWKLKNFEET